MNIKLSRDLKILLEGAAVALVGGALIMGVASAVANQNLQTASKIGALDNIQAKPVTFKGEGNIKVSAPKDGDKLTSPFAIAGQARVFEAVVSFRLKDASGKIITAGTALAKGGTSEKFSPFNYQVAIPKTTATAGTLEVYHASPKDGSDQDVVAITVKF